MRVGEMRVGEMRLTFGMGICGSRLSCLKPNLIVRAFSHVLVPAWCEKTTNLLLTIAVL